MSPLYNPGAGGGGAAAERISVPYALANPAPGDNGEAPIDLGDAGIIYRVETSHACRVRLYQTNAQLVADRARAAGVDPVGNHGCLLDLVTTPAMLNIDLSPSVSFGDLQADSSLELRVDVIADPPGNLDVTFKVVKLA